MKTILLVTLLFICAAINSQQSTDCTPYTVMQYALDSTTFETRKYLGDKLISTDTFHTNILPDSFYVEGHARITPNMRRKPYTIVIREGWRHGSVGAKSINIKPDTVLSWFDGGSNELMDTISYTSRSWYSEIPFVGYDNEKEHPLWDRLDKIKINPGWVLIGVSSVLAIFLFVRNMRPVKADEYPWENYDECDDDISL
jgi:hypothetical protein